MKQEVLPNGEIERYVQKLFDLRGQVKWATRIIKGILEADSPRISDIGRAMGGSVEANTRAVYRFLQGTDPREALKLLYREEAEYVIGDVTEMSRPQAKNTEYVGLLKDGETRGYDLLILATPYRGRAIPFQLVSYSSKTIADEVTSRNQEHWRAWAEVAAFLEDTALLLDREFCCEEDLEAMQRLKVQGVVRLNVGLNPTLTFEKGDFRRTVSLALTPGERRSYKGVWYKGLIRLNVAGYWDPEFREPLWVITLMEDPEQALQLYLKRMKIEEHFRDLKNLLHLDRLMNKSRQNMEKLVAMVCIAYAIGLLVGEKLRDRAYRGRGKKMGKLLGAVRAAEGGDSPQ
jgi:hypothetical protein